MVFVYHFTNKENVPLIIEQGVSITSKYNKLNSILRDKAIYAWLRPDHDKMGYLEDKDYVCLQIEIDSSECFVANMDIISAAFVNYVGAGEQEVNLPLCEELVKYYDNSAVNVDRYINGMFRAPEVIIPQSIEPNAIRVFSDVHYFEDNSLFNNSRIYNECCIKKLRTLANDSTNKLSEILDKLLNEEVIRKVAIHDDFDGLLATYEIMKSKEYFTIELRDLEVRMI